MNLVVAAISPFPAAVIPNPAMNRRRRVLYLSYRSLAAAYRGVYSMGTGSLRQVVCRLSDACTYDTDHALRRPVSAEPRSR